jgi:glycosyltransferase involved in cell wall biosynthesis
MVGEPEPMRILLISHGYPPFALAGVERVTQQTAAALTEAGHSVTVLSRRTMPAPPLPTIERTRHADGVDVIMISGGRAAPGGPFPGHQDRLERIFERILLEQLPDVVVIGHLMMHAPGYVAIAHRWHIPVVMELHDFYNVCERAHLERPTGELCAGPEGGRACSRHCFSEQEDAPGRWALRTHLFGLALSHADALICPSTFVADYFRDFGIAPERLQVIPNGISFVGRPIDGGAARTVKAPEEPLRLASLGVVAQHKGPHMVVEALRKARLPSVHYILFGALTQPYARQLRESARESPGLELRMYGAYDPQSLPQLLADVDAVIIPSLVWETFSIVAREAMVCGIPVIASRLGALPEAIREGENGMLFAPHRSAELAAVLQALDTDRSILARLRAGIKATDWITIGERTRRLEAVLRRVCSKGPASGEREASQPDLAALRTLLAPAQ